MSAAQEKAVLDWLDGQLDPMLDLLRRLVDIDSGSYDKAGVDRVGAEIRAFLDGAGIRSEVLPLEHHGDTIRAEVPASGASNAPIVLMGHRDTVFDVGEAGRRPFRVEGGRAYGPGVADMKAGLVMNSFVLAAFARFGGHPAPLVGLYTGDEEIASPTSRPRIEAAARGARAVFNSEPGRPDGNIVTGRKGGVFMRMTVRGKAAHSGASFADGASAIEAAARKIVALHALTDLEHGVTLNVGLVSGGQSVNAVAAEARAEIDLRFVTPAQRAEAMAAIGRIVEAVEVPGTSAVLEILGEFLPLVETEASRRLFAHYAACSGDLGVPVEGEFTGGCADSGFAAAQGAPVVCAVGPCGGRAHSPDEYMMIDTLVPRARALALAIMRLPAGG